MQKYDLGTDETLFYRKAQSNPNSVFYVDESEEVIPPEQIIKEIEEGIKKTKGNYKVIVDRTEAIKEAIKMANKLDIIVLAGKGHEPYQEINGEKLPYDERVIVKEIIG